MKYTITLFALLGALQVSALTRNPRRAPQYGSLGNRDIPPMAPAATNTCLCAPPNGGKPLPTPVFGPPVENTGDTSLPDEEYGAGK